MRQILDSSSPDSRKTMCLPSSQPLGQVLRRSLPPSCTELLPSGKIVKISLLMVLYTRRLLPRALMRNIAAPPEVICFARKESPSGKAQISAEPPFSMVAKVEPSGEASNQTRL